MSEYCELRSCISHIMVYKGQPVRAYGFLELLGPKPSHKSALFISDRQSLSFTVSLIMCVQGIN